MLVVASMLAVMIGVALPLVAAPPVAGADTALPVIGARLGVHPEMTRFVLEIGGRVHFRAATLGDPYRVVVDLPDVVWPGGETAKAGVGVIRSYHMERLRPGAARLVLDTTGPARIRGAMVIEPSEGHRTRLVLDVEPISREAFAREQDHGRGRGAAPGVVPPSEHAARPPPEGPKPVGRAAAPASPPVPAAASAPPPVTPPVPVALTSPSLPPQPASEPDTGPKPPSAPAPEASADPEDPTSGRPADPPVNPVSNAGDRQPPAPAAAPLTPPAQLAALVTPAAVPGKPRRGAPTGKPVIALDPGHGGVDPGATGYNGIHEKDITLATAREVRRQLEATGRYRVMMTRDEDEFIPLRERVARAREADAQLFISLHADSIVGSQIRGMSIYTLSDKASDHEAETLAAKENRSDAIGGIDLSHENDQVATILIDLAQRDTRNHSRHFAGLVLHEVGHIQKLLPKADRSAGFAVLTAPDVPSVLIEMGYLSSPEDAGLLTQADHRQRLAASLVHAIDGYFGWLGGGRRS